MALTQHNVNICYCAIYVNYKSTVPININLSVQRLLLPQAAYMVYFNSFIGTYLMSYKLLGAGVAAVSIIGSGIGIGIVFGLLILGVSLNPEVVDRMFGYAILGFALTESIALFGLMMSFLILYGV
jgi:F-type H+-transporting ATPase subunit c